MTWLNCLCLGVVTEVLASIFVPGITMMADFGVGLATFFGVWALLGNRWSL